MIVVDKTSPSKRIDSASVNLARIDLVPLGGIAGDMFAASLFGAFPNLYEKFCGDLAALGVDGIDAKLEDRMSGGLHAKYFNVTQETAQKPPRTLSAVTEFFQARPLANAVAEHAIGIFSLLAQAEAEVHGKTIDTIHFHEVSDWDSVIDILAAAGVIARLECPVWRTGALPLGGGTVNTAHGDIPVPAPATTALLKGYQWHDDGVAGERVTPTGAAILAYLKAVPIGNATTPASLHVTGSGCGTRELEGRANLLRVTAFTEANEHKCDKNLSESHLLHDEVVRLAFEVDDMTAEEIAWATDALRNASGVYDVACVSMHGKKGRASTGVRVIASKTNADAVTDKCFAVTSTIGIRVETIQRVLLRRFEKNLQDTSVKLVARPEGRISAKASSDDLASASSLSERRARAELNRDTALREHQQTE